MNRTKQGVGVKPGVSGIRGHRYVPEGVTSAADGTAFVGSLFEGCIMRAPAGARRMAPFVEAGANGLVSVLGLWADEVRQTLWACSSDAGNGRLTGRAPAGV